MAKIMIEAKTQEKDRKASRQDDNAKQTDAVAKIVVFDDVETDLVSFFNFHKLAAESNEWWFLNTAGYMNIVDEHGKKNKEYYQARRAKLSTSSDEEMVLTIERQELLEADFQDICWFKFELQANSYLLILMKVSLSFLFRNIKQLIELKGKNGFLPFW